MLTVNGRRLLCSTSYGGGTLPWANVVQTADFILLHGNGVAEPDSIVNMVRRTRCIAGYTALRFCSMKMTIFNFHQPNNNFVAAVSAFASWGYFDYRMQGEGFDEGYQSVPVNWGISSERKRGFFRLLGDITGASLN